MSGRDTRHTTVRDANLRDARLNGTAVSGTAVGGTAGGGPPASRFLSEAECQALVKRVISMARGGGETKLSVSSTWTGNLRWARNRILTSGDVRTNAIGISRSLRGAGGGSSTNQLDDARLLEGVRRAERLEMLSHEGVYYTPPEPFIEEYLKPKIWFDSTYHQDPGARAELMHKLVAPAEKAGMLSAGYIQVSATGRAVMNAERVWYYPYTWAQYSVTVRDPSGTGSGWAGVDWNDWDRIDAEHLSEVALEKCLRSRNPVRLEPGRYTAILEPQAVGDLCQRLFCPVAMDRELAENGDPNAVRTSRPWEDYHRGQAPIIPFGKGYGYSKIGEKVIDERLSVTQDPTDPECAFPPFGLGDFVVAHPATWIEDGVLKELAYGRQYAIQALGRNTAGLGMFSAAPWIGSFHMRVKGETATVEEMIATTKRGILVTRFWGVSLPPIDMRSLLLSGYTRDGTWLIEDGKISKPIKNFRFTESPAFILNNVEQVGVPQRIFAPNFPIVAPALKVRDFSFTSLTDAV